MGVNYSGAIFKKLGQLVSLYNGSTIKDRTTIKNSVKALIRSYFIDQYPLEDDVECTFITFDDCFDHLVKIMTDDSESVDGNAVSAGSVTTDPDNTGDGSVTGLTATQMLLNGDVIRLYFNGSNWDIYSLLRGKIAAQAETDEEFGSDTDYIGYVFTIANGSGADFVTGDQFIIEAATVSDDGIFQSFFRDVFSKVLPYETDGSETVDDALAEDTVGS